MRPQIPRELANYPGPVASVYVDVSRDHGGAPQEVRLRWKALAAELRKQGADEKTVDAVGQVATEPHSQPGGAGRALFAADSKVLHEADLPRPPRREITRWAALPHLLPLLAQTPEYVPHIVVQLGRTTAVITGVDRAGREVFSTTQEGQDHPAHKTGGGGAAHFSMHHRTEEVWARNARMFAAEVDRAVAALHAELVVLTGDVRARSLVRDALGEHSRAITEQVTGPAPEDYTTDDTVGSEIRQLAAQHATKRTQAVIEQFDQERGRDSGLAVTGLGPVIHALQQSQVSTLLLRDDPSSDRQIWVGPEPMQLALTEDDLRGIGAPVLAQDRADAALVRAIAGSGAELVLLPHPAAGSEPGQAGSAAGDASPPTDQPDLVDGLGALLRFTTPT